MEAEQGRRAWTLRLRGSPRLPASVRFPLAGCMPARALLGHPIPPPLDAIAIALDAATRTVQWESPPQLRLSPKIPRYSCHQVYTDAISGA